MMSEVLLERLQARELLGPELAEAVRAEVARGEPLDRAILSVDSLSEAVLLAEVAAVFGVELVGGSALEPSPGLLETMPARLLTRHGLLPLSRENGRLRVATSSLFERTGLDMLRLATGLAIEPVLAPSELIERGLSKHLGVGAATVQSLVAGQSGIQIVDDRGGEDVDLAEAAEDASIIQFVNQVLLEAIERRATDVHFEPFEDRLSVRYRVDGVLQPATLPRDVRRFQAAIVSRLKILSHLDIAEKRLPQDGRIKLRVEGRELDVRVSVIPMLYGEAVVLRLLDRGAALVGLEGLGMSPEDLRVYQRVLRLPHGIVLVTGPTGSGKTTTLYASLARINDVAQKIITVEDPIEYHLPGVNQIQVDAKTGLTFGRGLRAILRHDPDVLLIGEIRDRETAEIAVQASLTGHLVFSTLHTNDAPGAITRLIDMGVEPYLVASSLELVVAQRLVRLICPHCRTSFSGEEYERVRGELEGGLPAALYAGRGCDACNGTGYRGRKGVFEIMPISDAIRRHVTERSSSQRVRETARAEGMKSLREDGWRLIESGGTTLEEVLRVTKDEHGIDWSSRGGR